MKRHGFGLIWAILVLVAIGSLLAFSLRFSATTLSTTIDEHAQIQLRLYEKSVMEIAILELQKRIPDPAKNHFCESLKFNGIYEFKFCATKIEGSDQVYLLDVWGEVKPPNESDRALTITARKIVKP